MKKRKKIEVSEELEADIQGAGDIIKNLIFFFPFKPETLSYFNLQDPNSPFLSQTRLNFFFDKIINPIRNNGYARILDLQKLPHRVVEIIYDPYTTNSISECLTLSILNNSLMKIYQDYNESQILKKNWEFKYLSFIIETYYSLISLKDNQGGWNEFIKGNSEDQNFSSTFGISSWYNDRWDIMESSEFQKAINDLLKRALGKEFLWLFDDGKLHYVEETEESMQERISIKFLVKRKMNSVINSINEIRDFKQKGDIINAMRECRVALENLFTDLLISHKIIDTINRKGKTVLVENLTVKPLTILLKENIENIFNFPKYSKKNQLKDGFRHLILSSGDIFGGMADNIKHGKGSFEIVKSGIKYVPKMKDVEAVFSNLIMLINLLLPFEK